jgi:hypothetical protein
MGVQYRAGPALKDDIDMQQRFGGRLGIETVRIAALRSHFKNLFGGQFPFIHAAWSDGETQRLPRYNSAKIPAGSKRPATRVKASADRSEVAGHRAKFLIHPPPNPK